MSTMNVEVYSIVTKVPKFLHRYCDKDTVLFGAGNYLSLLLHFKNLLLIVIYTSIFQCRSNNDLRTKLFGRFNK